MKRSVQKVLIGVGIILGLQLILAILIRLYIETLDKIGGGPLISGDFILIGVSLGTFFVGGLFMGFIEERVALGIPIIAGILALALWSFVSLVFRLPDSTFLVTYAQEGDWLALFTTVAGGIVAIVAGSLIGERFRMPESDDLLARSVFVLLLAVVLTGPFYFLIPYGLPLSGAIVATVFILLFVAGGYYRFSRGATFEKSIEEISINPERQPPS